MFLCSRLDLPGGIERAIVNTANLFSENGYKVTLLVLDETSRCFYPLNSSVAILQQSLSFGITKEGNIFTRKVKLLSDVLKLRRILKTLKPNRVIATEYPFAAAAILSGTRKRANVFAWEHHHYYELRRSKFWDRLFHYSCPRLDAIICLNEDEKKLFQRVNNNVVVIPNFITPGASPSSLNNKVILTIARLNHVKGMDRVVELAKLVLMKHPDWKWKLIGTGEMEKDIYIRGAEQGLLPALDIQHPRDHQIMNEYENASVYVMLSRNECFPMVLLEAQSAGLPCIAFDCETGPRHIIKQDKNGILVENDNLNAMAAAISSLIDNEEKRKAMGRHALHDIKQFSPEIVFKLWDSQLKQF